jgi:hypothetical protein
VVVQGGERVLHYSHWAAASLARDLFWGPEHALRFARRQQRLDQWLDERWCEGGAVLDADARSLVLFGGPEVDYDVELRAVYLELLAAAWSGWRVGWAHEGIADLARAAGVDSAVVRVEELDPRPAPAQPGRWTETVATVGDARGDVRVYALATPTANVLASGPALLDQLAHLEPTRPLPLDEIPPGGVHLVPHERRLWFWLTHRAMEAQERVRRAWPGWDVVWLRDRYPEHEELARPVLRFPARPDPELVALLERILLADQSDPVRGAVSTARLLADEGRDVQMSPAVFAHEQLTLDAARRRRILDAALAARG